MISKYNFLLHQKPGRRYLEVERLHGGPFASDLVPYMERQI